MVARVKSYKAGFVESDSNLTPDSTLADILEWKEKTGHSTVAITDDGTARVEVLGIVSSEGFSEWQKLTIDWIREHYGDTVKVGAGNVVDEEGFRFLAEAGADFIKIGIGGGSICITREQKGIGRGQATSVIEVAAARDKYGIGGGSICITREQKGIGRGQATSVIEVAAARDKYFEETGVYIPICSDGGIVYDHHITLALAMGSDFVMLGRYFSRFDESPTNKVNINGSYMKEYMFRWWYSLRSSYNISTCYGFWLRYAW